MKLQDKSGNKVGEKNKTMVRELTEMTALGINDQEIANGLGVDPEVLAELKESFTEGPDLTVGNVFTGWWSNNWTEIDDIDN